ncbi:transcription termination factor NusA [Hornefia butyriciproducens]|uniref:transcription termination factor NusA n=1 Tax=Hornefia butyriciproducens TaxID=2652293 RepID=UPI0023F067EC|nr:transcription termination factor NusA [Hornefia butyriciproducens]MCI7326308.1 transcription termination factor NusA [Clostridiales bacterium]MDD6299859.1 transcription termination factor NusA [Hornefia butyriciproducens]MDY2989933.1 transcription termination factor NusA [Hornefia butyriciproducens]
MNREFIEAMEQLEKEKHISKDVLLETIESALVSAYKKNYGTAQNVRVVIDPDDGEIAVLMRKDIVAEEDIEDDMIQMSLEEAHEIDPRYEIGDAIEFAVTPRDFGRIAAQTAKQVVVQRIREAERGMVYDDFITRQGEIVTGTVQRKSGETMFINIGRAEGILSANEQVPGEHFKVHQRLKVYIMDVKKTTKGPQVFLSRSHPGLVKMLFELEVPEIQDGTVEIRGIAREAGSRTKMAVYSEDENVDPVGACVGTRGSRVQSVVDELNGEKIDIIFWSDSPEELIANVLSPATVEEVIIEDEEEKTATAIVPDYQLSLAIGKQGQNVRLAAKVSGWKIDIMSHTQYEEALAAAEAEYEEDLEEAGYDEEPEEAGYDEEFPQEESPEAPAADYEEELTEEEPTEISEDEEPEAPDEEPEDIAEPAEEETEDAAEPEEPGDAEDAAAVEEPDEEVGETVEQKEE